MSTGEGRSLRRSFVLASAFAVCLILPAAAAATTRYAAPGGTATAAECTAPATPCTINEAATGIGVMAADEVVVEPGDYSDTAGDLGVDGFVNPTAGNIHGVLGQQRPVITLNDSHSFGAFNVSTGKTVSYLSIQSTVSDRGIFIGGGTVDAVIARATGSFGATCEHQSGVLRDTACIASSASGIAVGDSVGTSLALAPVLRNVTAISLGGSGFGLDYRVSGGGSLTVSAKSVIADGGSADIRVGGTSPSTTTLTIDHSNWGSSSELAGGTIVNGGNNQDQGLFPPALASDHVHQLSGSPTIDAGAVDGSSGSIDVDGQSRTLEGTADIGADEHGHATATSVACAPSSVQVGSASTCTITVTDSESSGATTPTGNVGLSSDTTGGTFGSAGICALVMLNSNQASCQITYTPGQVGSGSHVLTAAYVGDSTHEPSQGTTSVGVAAHTTSTSVSCLPASVPIALPTTCTATVTDTAPNGAAPPAGSVSFGSDTTGGAFGSGGSCTLNTASATTATCSVTYTPGQLGSGSHQITGTYGGDATHQTSNGPGTVSVTKRSSGTAVSCAPSSLSLGSGTSTCLVTVNDTDGTGPLIPTGAVTLSSNAAGSFSGECATLAPATSDQASCTVTYTPSVAGSHQLTATYAGDGSHGGSQASASVDVAAQQGSTSVGVNITCVTLRKKLKKAKKAHDTAKVRKLKKKLRKLGC